MTLLMSEFDNVLKDFYEGAIRETINSEVPAYKTLSESDRAWSGRRVVWPVHTARSPSVGARAENANLPAAGNQTHLLSVVTAAYNYGRIEVTGPTLRAGKNAFAEAMAVEMEGITRDLTNDLGRQTWGDGTGRLAQVAADAASSTSITVYNRYFEPGQPGARFVYANQLLDAGSVAAPTQDFSSQTVISVALSTSPATTTDTVTISNSALTISQCDTFLFVQGAGGIEMMGIQGLVDVFSEDNWWNTTAFASATVQGINRQTNAQWNAIVLGNSGTERVLESRLIQTAFDEVHQQSGKDPDTIWGKHDVISALLDSVAADRRYVSNGGPMKYEAGFSALSYNGVPLVRDRQALNNCLLVFRREALKIYTLLDLEWASDDGSILSRVSNRDSFEAFLRCYKNLGIDTSPKELCMIRDIRVDF